MLAGLLSGVGGISKAAVALPFDPILAGMVTAGLCIEALCFFLGVSREALDEHIVRLGLRSPPDIAMRRSRSGWSVDDTRRLIAWRTTGVHPEVIGPNLAISRSANAVRSKARRLGLAAPPRKSLFRPDPAQLSFVFQEVGAISSLDAPRNPDCGRPAGPVSVAGVGPDKRCPNPPPREIAAQAAQPVFAFRPATESAAAAHIVKPKPRTPTAEEEVDLSDLTWLGELSTRRSGKVEPGACVYTNRAAVWAIGMLTMSGLPWREAARRAGMTPTMYRTVKSRCLVPTEPQRKNKNAAYFDEEVARETQRRGGFILRRSLRGTGPDGSLEWFWVHKSDRSTYYSPFRRPPRAHNEPRARREMRIVTREILNAEARMGIRTPFAEQRASLGA